LLKDGVAKIADFGVAKAMTTIGLKTKIGTDYYMAP
jgi:serine/threonine protein kinase